MYKVKDLQNHKDLLPLVAKLSSNTQMMYNEVQAIERMQKYAIEHSIKYADVMISIPICYA